MDMPVVPKSLFLVFLITALAGMAVVVSAADQPVADFVVRDSFTSGIAPFTAGFDDRSTNAALYSWEFGDGSTSFLKNPEHTYQYPGTFTVTLTVKDATGTLSSTKTIPDCISVAGEPGSHWTTVPTTTETTSPDTTQTPGPAGIISVTSEPTGAMVSLDGAQQGITPITLYHVKAGPHIVLVHLKGYPDFQKRVTVEQEKTTVVGADFAQSMATTVATTMTTAVRATTVPVTTAPEPPQEGASAAAAMMAPSSTGTIHITCTGCSALKPSGSTPASTQYQVYILNLKTGQETLKYFGEIKTSDEALITNAIPGPYRIRVTPADYRSQSKQVNVTPGTVTSVSFSGPTFVRAPGFEAVLSILAFTAIVVTCRRRV